MHGQPLPVPEAPNSGQEEGQNKDQRPHDPEGGEAEIGHGTGGRGQGGALRQRPLGAAEEEAQPGPTPMPRMISHVMFPKISVILMPK